MEYPVQLQLGLVRGRWWCSGEDVRVTVGMMVRVRVMVMVRVRDRVRVRVRGR